MSGGIIFRNGGPVGWLGDRQDRTSLSSCEAEIRATNSTSKKVVDFCNVCQSMVESGHVISNIASPTLLFNDNDACVRWSYNMTSKAARHIEIRENSVREWIQSKLLTVKHVSGKINPADIFTKEMRDGKHYRRLRDSFMSHLSDFVNDSLLMVHHGRQSAGSSIPAAAHAVLAAGPLSYFSALASSSFCQSLPAISHFSSAGRQLIRNLYGFVPSGFTYHWLLSAFLFFWVLLFFAGFWFHSLLCSGTHLVQCGASSWTHGWGVLSLSVILE
jgi:hypothetical protein